MPDYSAHETEASVVAALATAATDVRLTTINGVPILAVPDGVKLEDKSDLLNRPLRLVATKAFVDPESFANYIVRYKTDASLIVAKRAANVIEASLDYHDANDLPSWNFHKAVLNVAKHEDYKAWEKLCAEPINQTQFAEAVDDLMHTIASPEGAVLQDMILKFQALRDVRFSSAINLTDGTCALAYSEQETNTENRAAFPTKMTLVLPVFEGDITTKCEVRIRYRCRDNKLTFSLSIARKSDIERKAWLEICEAVKNLTGLDVLNGS